MQRYKQSDMTSCGSAAVSQQSKSALSYVAQCMVVTTAVAAAVSTLTK